jgi:hypothetical protein
MRLLPAHADDRLEERGADLSLPDPYLDPAWPDERGEELEGRYGEGRSDSVEDIPLDEDAEMQEELQALEEDLERALPPEIFPAEALPPVADEAGPSDVSPPVPEMPDVPSLDEDDDGFERDPVEW